MIILHVTDFHFNKRWFDWLPNNAPPHDLLVMSGDLLNLSDATSQQKQIDWVSTWINEYPHPMCLCSGNHDLEWDAKAERWTPAYWLRSLASPKVWTDGQRVALDGISLLNIGCTTRPKGGKADLWVVHAPPAKTLVATRASGRDAGDPDLLGPARRYAPRVVFSGHVHDPIHWCEQTEPTLYLNPGRTPDALFPNHILLKTDDLSSELITVDKWDTSKKFPATARIPIAVTDAPTVSVLAN
ncbi:MAG: metallophosphoesterase family protein [Nibricoccus sp.]